MQRLVIILSLFLFVFVSCQEEEEPILFSETGTVIDYAGAGDCNFVIELDNGNRIQPIDNVDQFCAVFDMFTEIERHAFTHGLFAIRSSTVISIVRQVLMTNIIR